MQGLKNGQKGQLFDEYPSLLTAAHELKAPLALVRQLALSLETDLIADPAERAKVLRQITLTTDHALRLTTDLTRSSRLDDSLFTLEPLNPQQLCEEVAHELTPLYKAHGRDIRVSSRHRRILAIANRDLLRRIILTFGDNALHYSPDNTPVDIYAGRVGGGTTIRIKVRDYGPALPPDIWRRLQYTVGTDKQALHSRPQSSGLGLLIAGRFAGAMQGQIGAVRHRDGASFYVDLLASTQLSLL